MHRARNSFRRYRASADQARRWQAPVSRAGRSPTVWLQGQHGAGESKLRRPTNARHMRAKHITTSTRSERNIIRRAEGWKRATRATDARTCRGTATGRRAGRRRTATPPPPPPPPGGGGGAGQRGTSPPLPPLSHAVAWEPQKDFDGPIDVAGRSESRRRRRHSPLGFARLRIGTGPFGLCCRWHCGDGWGTGGAACRRHNALARRGGTRRARRRRRLGGARCRRWRRGAGSRRGP